MTTSITQALTKLESLFKKLAWDALVASALASLFAAAPWLAWPPMRQIVSKVVTMLTDKLFALLQLEVDVGAVKFLNTEHQKAFDTAAVKLKIILQESGADSDAYQKAEADEIAAFARFVRYNQ